MSVLVNNTRSVTVNGGEADQPTILPNGAGRQGCEVSAEKSRPGKDNLKVCQDETGL